ncbi:TetR/AcrR family transcriptional regulator [Jidongwangia harbinensis]|uniref:TetR/AcrR family transcriptional regulator n=1 Tax=Jidongwangia harbinensis TaxID=2878561 RepID=UPI001CD9F533|nr:TetR/AcrR family transcriptional regulator [Jidongwangia harbinensis]MCA2214193.1 TetR/AcrR family transcriptional regulator [Jidongwangia harbinensis]
MRADAVRNREAVLAAAGRLFDAAADPERVSMDDIAAAAGVGKGTLFRRFGDRLGLIRALYEQRSVELHAALATAPGRPAAQRALDLLEAMLRFKLDNRVLALALENAGAGSPYRNEAYDRWHALLTGLVAEARGPESADYLAHVLLAAVRSDLVEHLRDRSDDRWTAGLRLLVRSVLSPAEGDGTTPIGRAGPGASAAPTASPEPAADRPHTR